MAIISLQKWKILSNRNWLAFAGIASAQIRMLPAEVQFAEKIHAYTVPRSTPNSRVRDLVDMILLIQEGKLSSDKVKSANA